MVTTVFRDGDLSREEQQTVSQGFERHSDEVGAPAYAKRRVCWMSHDDDGALVGALTADVLWDWAYIDELWVRQDQRRHGLGGALMAQVERYASDRGLAGVWLWTQSWQAASFYARLGYQRFAHFPHFPKGHERIGFRKLLRPTTTDADLLRDAAERGIRYVDGIRRRPVRPTTEAVATLRADVGGDMPMAGRPAADVLRTLDELGSPATVASTGDRYFGYVVGGAHPVTIAAQWLATAWDQNAALVDMSPAAAHFDDVATRWLAQVLRLPDGVAGGLVTGATAGNVVALAAARGHLLARAGWDAENDGLFGAPPLRVVVSEEVHDSVRKALAVTGLGARRVETVPTDGQGRLRADRLPPLDERTIVCVQAGHVHSGAIDPVHEVVARAREVKAWVHVDGAFGLWARASDRFAAHTAGLEQADSWSVDAHKWLNVPYDTGAVFTTHDAAIRRAMAVWEPLRCPARQPAAYTVEQSRRARGVEVFAALAHLGREGVARAVAASCRLARRLADQLRAGGLTVCNDVVLNQVVVWAGSDEATSRLGRALTGDGTVGCTVGAWQGRVVLGLSVSSWRTDGEASDCAAEVILRTHGRTARPPSPPA